MALDVDEGVDVEVVVVDDDERRDFFSFVAAVTASASFLFLISACAPESNGIFKLVVLSSNLVPRFIDAPLLPMPLAILFDKQLDSRRPTEKYLIFQTFSNGSNKRLWIFSSQ